MPSESKAVESLCLFEGEDGCASVEDVELEPLSWRNDPDKNYSDWTIEIVCAESGETSYHVHKAVLGVGPRRCKYFSTLFQTQANVPERKVSTSRIVLAEPHANVFPLLLDFCYGLQGGNSRNFVPDSSATAVALRSITNYFGCDALRKQVNIFIEKDMTSSNLEKGPLYWTLATVHDDVILAESACRICAEHLEELEDEDILQLPMDLFRRLVVSPHLKCHSEALGWLVADFLQRHLNCITVQLVLELTNPEILPQIDLEEGLAFFRVLRHLQPTPEEWVELESLCHRCGMSLAREAEWATWNVEDERHILWSRWAQSIGTPIEGGELPLKSQEEKEDLTSRADNTEHHAGMLSLWAEVFMFISRLSASLVEAQRVYHSELLVEQQNMQMKNQLLQAQVVAQQQQLQQLNDGQYRKIHQDLYHQVFYSPSAAKSVPKIARQPELSLPRNSYTRNRSNSYNHTCPQDSAIERGPRTRDEL